MASAVPERDKHRLVGEKNSSERVDPVEALIQIVNEAQERDAEDERRLYDSCPMSGLDFRQDLSLRD
jgi:hypothetical protein